MTHQEEIHLRFFKSLSTLILWKKTAQLPSASVGKEFILNAFKNPMHILSDMSSFFTVTSIFFLGLVCFPVFTPVEVFDQILQIPKTAEIFVFILQNTTSYRTQVMNTPIATYT